MNRLHQASLLKGGVLVVPDNDMVQHFDSQNRPGFCKPFGYRDIIRAGPRIAQRMVM